MYTRQASGLIFYKSDPDKTHLDHKRKNTICLHVHVPLVHVTVIIWVHVSVYTLRFVSVTCNIHDNFKNNAYLLYIVGKLKELKEEHLKLQKDISRHSQQ